MQKCGLSRNQWFFHSMSLTSKVYTVPIVSFRIAPPILEIVFLELAVFFVFGWFPWMDSMNNEFEDSALPFLVWWLNYGITCVCQGFKVTRQSLWRSSLSWQAVSTNRNPSAGHFMSNQQSLGIKLAQLSRDASAAVVAHSFFDFSNYEYFCFTFHFGMAHPILHFAGCSPPLDLE